MPMQNNEKIIRKQEENITTVEGTAISTVSGSEVNKNNIKKHQQHAH